MHKPILCLDFDGTIHSYESGWQGADVILDKPVAGSFQFIHEVLNAFDVHVFSARSGRSGGIEAMKAWFLKHGWEADASGEPAEITFPTHKPPAQISLDDRAITFTGTWPSIQVLQEFRPWNALDI